MKSFDITYRRMGESTATHISAKGESIEQAVESIRKLFPGCLIISVLLVS